MFVPLSVANVAAPSPASSGQVSSVPHIVTVNSDGNIQRIIQQPQQQPQPSPQFQIVRTPSGLNQLILPSPAPTQQSVATPTQITLRHAAPQQQILTQAIRLPNGTMAIRSKFGRESRNQNHLLCHFYSLIRWGEN